MDNLLTTAIHSAMSTSVRESAQQHDHFGRLLNALLAERDLSQSKAGFLVELHSRTIARWVSLARFDGEKRNLIRLLRKLNEIQPLTPTQRQSLLPALGTEIHSLDQPSEVQRLASAMASVSTLEILARLIRRHGEDTIRGILFGIEVSGNIFNSPARQDDIAASASAQSPVPSASPIKPPPGAVAKSYQHEGATVTEIIPTGATHTKAARAKPRRASN